MHIPASIFPEYGTRHADEIPEPIDFAQKLSAEFLKEYDLEMYLLQRIAKLEELVGSGITELYNILFGYQRRYLDVLTVHRDENGEMLKATIVELKARALDGSGLDRALDELTFYMFWMKDQTEKGKIGGNADSIHGILLSPWETEDSLKNVFVQRAKDYAVQYGINAKKIRWIGYKKSGTELIFSAIE